jgi:arsenite-transporting ATPase
VRIIVFSGKGGSGVSTIAAATAAAVAEAGGKVLAFGLGEGLGASLGQALAPEPARIHPGLWAAESRRRHDCTEELREWVGDLLEWRGVESGLAEDLVALPGVSQVSHLLALESHVAAGAFETIVADAGPLGQFLDLPPALDAAARWLDRLFAPREQTIFEPFLRAFAGDYATAGDDILERGRGILTRLAGLRDVLTDSSITSVRLVTTPDPAAIEDIRRSLACLTLFGYGVDALMVNRVISPEVTDPFFIGLRQQEEAAFNELGGVAAPIPVLAINLAPAPPRDLGALVKLAGAAYAGRQAANILHQGPGRLLLQADGRDVLRLSLPFARREDLGLEQTEDSVEVHLDGRRCVLPLPPHLRYRQAQSWAYEEGELRVTFGP